jgi:hypothetical protein
VMEDQAALRSKAGKVAERTKTMQEHQDNAGKRHMGTRSQFEGIKVEKEHCAEGESARNKEETPMEECVAREAEVHEKWKEHEKKEAGRIGLGQLQKLQVAAEHEARSQASASGELMAKTHKAARGVGSAKQGEEAVAEVTTEGSLAKKGGKEVRKPETKRGVEAQAETLDAHGIMRVKGMTLMGLKETPGSASWTLESGSWTETEEGEYWKAASERGPQDAGSDTKEWKEHSESEKEALKQAMANSREACRVEEELRSRLAKELQERAPVPSATPKPPGVDERVAPAVRYHVHCLDQEGFTEFVGSDKTLLGQANYEQVERMLDKFFVIGEKGEIKIRDQQAMWDIVGGLKKDRIIVLEEELKEDQGAKMGEGAWVENAPSGSGEKGSRDWQPTAKAAGDKEPEAREEGAKIKEEGDEDAVRGRDKRSPDPQEEGGARAEDQEEGGGEPKEEPKTEEEPDWKETGRPPTGKEWTAHSVEKQKRAEQKWEKDRWGKEESKEMGGWAQGKHKRANEQMEGGSDGTGNGSQSNHQFKNFQSGNWWSKKESGEEGALGAAQYAETDPSEEEETGAAWMGGAAAEPESLPPLTEGVQGQEVEWESLGAPRGQSWVPATQTWDWSNNCFVPIIWEKLGYTHNGRWTWFTKWVWKDGKNREVWSAEVATKGGKDKGGGKGPNSPKGGKEDGGKGKDGKTQGATKGKEGKKDGKGAGKDGKEGDQEGSEKAAGSAGMEDAKGKGGVCEGGTGTAGPSPMQVAVMSMKDSKFPDTGENGRTRGDDLAWDHYSLPTVFTPEMKFVVGLPQENLQKWFGERTWAGLLGMSSSHEGIQPRGAGRSDVLCFLAPDTG